MIVPRAPYEAPREERLAAACEPITPEMWAALRDAYPDAGRLDACFRLARDLATCEALWRGEHVSADQLDRDVLAKAREDKLVHLVRPVDLVLVVEPETEEAV